MAVNINVYWGPRKRTAKDSIPQLQAHFRALAIADERLASWAPLGRSLKKAMASEPIDTSAASNLQHLLEKGQNKTDIAPRQPIPELGYRVSLWNQRRGNVEASTSIHCGAYSEYLSRDSQNNACLELNCMAGAEPFGAEVLLALFHRFVEIWKPDWGSIWRDVQEGHPASSREHPTRVQYAFYQQQGLASQGRTVGKEVGVPQGRMWVDETAAPILEEV
ncbi:hypothetical protein EOA27_31395 [Mesorhizobium sp. M2A.F.Ca.ET.037.01.1.1]|uniref:Imm52 family immunity protein n=1 Tax=unclassified Mesorhizobium TaxID=325217 RepID=UPI000F7644F4|nr:MULTISPECIES: Imm52 family immunity protein [unclassified Mesorhizobium]RUX98657.1 hypothetical protein EOA25_27240 [Mesorhizobium sp. M2A.F.Ca.ET.040.01.1.1]RVC64323.1 hypothetical protein EN759_24690 [Mesorhizobium sp. M00.F.Ca.ET.038.03.1.1]RVC73120.1 hypothetical protein EN766_21725 [Mesorhizobium sp. M2A.F.Ca.ET.046.02.1.1]AZO33222.1 hypothetical protein EJ072_00820 [Mesorhizobium sp. M2A.F.Ca.ET.046.03.2.1]RUX03148.1 hypothetical protein EOA27_31395 [Mesorhizobium sp. M2A.F.Ca.ET.037.